MSPLPKSSKCLAHSVKVVLLFFRRTLITLCAPVVNLIILPLWSITQDSWNSSVAFKKMIELECCRSEDCILQPLKPPLWNKHLTSVHLLLICKCMRRYLLLQPHTIQQIHSEIINKTWRKVLHSSHCWLKFFLYPLGWGVPRSYFQIPIYHYIVRFQVDLEGEQYFLHSLYTQWWWLSRQCKSGII